MKKITFVLTLLLLFGTVLTVLAGEDVPSVDWWNVTASAESSTGGDFSLDSIIGQTVASGSENSTSNGYGLENGFLTDDGTRVPTAIFNSSMTIATHNPLTTITFLLSLVGLLLLLTSHIVTKRQPTKLG